MSTVKYKLADGLEPKDDGGVLRLKTPLSLEVGLGQERQVRLGISFDCPVLLLEFEGTQRQAVRLVNNTSVVPAGQEVVLFLKSAVPDGVKNAPPALFERGDTLAQVVPLLHSYKLSR